MAYINQRFIPPDKTTEKEKEQNQWKALLLAQRKQPNRAADFQDRFNDIELGGQQATAYESKMRSKREAAQLEAQQKALQNMISRNINVNVPANPQFSGGVGNTPGGNSSFARFMSAISGRESGGNYNARNRDTGAMGKYQIMPGNIQGSHKGWDYEALGYDVSPQQFMSNPQLQEAIAKYKLQQYYNKYGPRGAAIAWYAGPGAVNYSSGALNRGQGKYSSINQYANGILRQLGLL
jgi:hypothetical protein